MFEPHPHIIRDGQVVTNPWQLLSVEALDDSATPVGDKAIMPLAAWLAKLSRGDTAASPLPGVWLAPEDDPQRLHAAVDGDLDRIPLIAIAFPRFVEGRGFSQAYLLRQRFGFRGELRAFGDLGRDHLWQLQRVGFNAFDLRTGTDLHDALHALADFPERYQASVDQPLPLFRRRDAAHV